MYLIAEGIKFDCQLLTSSSQDRIVGTGFISELRELFGTYRRLVNMGRSGK